MSVNSPSRIRDLHKYDEPGTPKSRNGGGSPKTSSPARSPKAKNNSKKGDTPPISPNGADTQGIKRNAFSHLSIKTETATASPSAPSRSAFLRGGTPKTDGPKSVITGKHTAFSPKKVKTGTPARTGKGKKANESSSSLADARPPLVRRGSADLSTSLSKPPVMMAQAARRGSADMSTPNGRAPPSFSKPPMVRRGSADGTHSFLSTPATPGKHAPVETPSAVRTQRRASEPMAALDVSTDQIEILVPDIDAAAPPQPTEIIHENSSIDFSPEGALAPPALDPIAEIAPLDDDEMGKMYDRVNASLEMENSKLDETQNIVSTLAAKKRWKHDEDAQEAESAVTQLGLRARCTRKVIVISIIVVTLLAIAFFIWMYMVVIRNRTNQ